MTHLSHPPEPSDLPALLAALAQELPGTHPYSLALLLQARTGRVVTGREAARLLREVKATPIPVRTRTE